MRNIISPLRYPGGKARIASFLKDLIYLNGFENVELFELYAGGAGASLDLLKRDVVRRIVLNDLDFHIYAFWKSILEHTHIFIDMIQKVSLDMKKWKEQKYIYDNYQNFSLLEVGFSTFYLNRTNHSGVLNAGPIGGKNQTGKYKIDARFNKKGLIKRIEEIASMKERISLQNRESIDLLKTLFNEPQNNRLYFLDPPYFAQGKNLYYDFYSPENHEELKNLLENYREANWLLTYDNCPPINQLYQSFSRAYLPMTYTLQRKVKTKEIMIFSDNLHIPKNLRIGNKSSILMHAKSEV